ncbi:MAG: nucleoside deaminase [Clostridium sp.]|uniref:nucleoside deaminase n=1 Tax=Clostridium sp. TaxID=1506 RepID=UPI00306154BC
MWKNIEKPWQEALSMAWEAYNNGTIPIGCVIVTKYGEVVSRGKNRIFDLESKHPLAGCNMAHAEMTAMLGLNEDEHPEIKSYILYTTMEPCPMCFGTMVMMSIRNLYFGARDNFAGATSLNDKLDYIAGKDIKIHQGSGEIEIFQLVLQSSYEYERNHPRIDSILSKFAEVNELAVKYAKELNNKAYFINARNDGTSIEEVYDFVLMGYIKFSETLAD